MFGPVPSSSIQNSITMISDTDIDSTGHNYKAWRSQILRKASGHSHSSSPGSRTASARITKTTSTSYSPHTLQRRRTTASQAARMNHRIPQDHAFLSQDPCPYNHANTTQSAHTVRPVSWHPGFGNAGYPMRLAEGKGLYHQQPFCRGQETMARQVPGLQFAAKAVALRDQAGNVSASTKFRPRAHWDNPSCDHMVMNPIANFEALAVSDSGQTSFGSCSPTQSQQSFLSPQEHSARESGYYSYMEPDSGICVPGYPSYHCSDDPRYQSIQIPFSYDASTLAHVWDFPPNNITTCAAPTSPSFLPIQVPSDGFCDAQVASKPPISIKKSAELVGMGLYDDKNGSMFASLDTVGDGASGLRDSLGKGLKLEETWEPPSKDHAEGDNADEGYSTDDAEEEFPVTLATQEAQVQISPAYGDLSNQTFFFDGDEQNGNYMMLDQEMHGCPSKPPDTVSGNFFWF